MGWTAAEANDIDKRFWFHQLHSWSLQEHSLKGLFFFLCLLAAQQPSDQATRHGTSQAVLWARRWERPTVVTKAVSYVNAESGLELSFHMCRCRCILPSFKYTVCCTAADGWYCSGICMRNLENLHEKKKRLLHQSIFRFLLQILGRICCLRSKKTVSSSLLDPNPAPVFLHVRRKNTLCG